MEEQSFDQINMTEWVWPKNLYMTEKITPTNMDDGTWPKKYDNDEHERLSMTESKKKIISLGWQTYWCECDQMFIISVIFNRSSSSS